MTIDPSNVTAFAFGLAFLAGLVSFLSPCVLPLVPAYIGYLGASAIGVGGLDGTAASTLDVRRRTMTNALFFVLGFSLVFILLGATIGLLGFFLQDFITGLVRAGAALLIVFGVRVAGLRMNLARWFLLAALSGVVMYLIKVGIPPTFEVRGVMDALMVFCLVLCAADMPAPYRLPLAVGAAAFNFFGSPFGLIGPLGASGLTAEPIRLLALLFETTLVFLIGMFVSQTDLFFMERRFEMHHSPGSGGIWPSMLMGAIFGAGWTPCVGPNLAAIFILGSESRTTLLAAGLLAVYSMGLGLPFLGVALAFDRFSVWLRYLKQYMGVITAVNGTLLVLIGCLLLSGRLATLAQFAPPWLTAL